MGTHNPSTLAQLQHGYTNLAQISQENRVNESNGHLEVMAALGGTGLRTRSYYHNYEYISSPPWLNCQRKFFILDPRSQRTGSYKFGAVIVNV